MVAFFLSCSKHRQRVYPRVVLSSDVLHCYPFKSGDEVGYHMVVPWQERLFNFELPLYLADHQLGVAFACYFASSHVVTKCKPARITSYAAWLLVALILNLSASLIMRSLRPLRTTPAPHVVLLDDPSAYTVHPTVGLVGELTRSRSELSIETWLHLLAYSGYQILRAPVTNLSCDLQDLA